MLDSFSFTTRVATCDISRGIPQNCSKCPIARRVLLDLSSRFRRWDKLKVEVDGSTVDVKFRDGRGQRHLLTADLPEKGGDFISQFDELKRTRKGNKRRVDPKQEGAPKPFVLELEFTSRDND